MRYYLQTFKKLLHGFIKVNHVMSMCKIEISKMRYLDRLKNDQ